VTALAWPVVALLLGAGALWLCREFVLAIGVNSKTLETVRAEAKGAKEAYHASLANMSKAVTDLDGKVSHLLALQPDSLTRRRAG
jgi:hypothetical protein